MEIDILREAASRVRPNPDLAAGTSSLLLYSVNQKLSPRFILFGSQRA